MGEIEEITGLFVGGVAGQIVVGGPLMMAVMIGAGALLPRAWMVAAAVAAFVACEAVMLGLDPSQHLPFALVAAALFAVAGRLLRTAVTLRRAA